MKLATIELFRYRLRLARPVTSDASLTHREGLVLRVEDESGHTGFGEIAPLPGFSSDTLEECRQQVARWRWSALGQEIPQHLEELSGGFDEWLREYRLVGAVRCGIEFAVLSLLAVAGSTSVRQLLCHEPQSKLRLNTLLFGTDREILEQAAQAASNDYRAVKLKVGRRSLGDDLELIGKVREAIGPHVQLRLDANGTFAPEEALQVIESVARYRVAYIEEPTSGLDNLRTLLDGAPAIPVAVDESLLHAEPTTLRDFRGLAAVILKPMLLGVERSMVFARAAAAIGAVPVVTSMFESGLGLALLAQLAAAITPAGVAVGLDTRGWLAEDSLAGEICTLPGLIQLGQLDDLRARLEADRLNEVAYD